MSVLDNYWGKADQRIREEDRALASCQGRWVAWGDCRLDGDIFVELVEQKKRLEPWAGAVELIVMMEVEMAQRQWLQLAVAAAVVRLAA